MTNSDSSTAAPKPKRRWFQFSLSTLFLVTTAVAIWVGVWTDRARKQQRAVEAILKRGGFVAYSYQQKAGRGKPTPPGPAWLRNLLGIDYLDHITYGYLPSDSFTDADLEHLEGLPGLENLILASANITDAGLAHLEGLHRLENLQLYGDRITDDGLAHLGGLHRLESLTLRSERITDAGLVHLQGLRELKSLSLVGCSITDAGMDHLTPLVKLRKLRSWGPPDEPVKSKVVDALGERTQLEFVNVPLIDVCDYLQDFHGIKLQIDDVALKDAKIDPNVTAVTCCIKGIPLHRALHSMLEPLRLDWQVGQGGLVITTREVVAPRHAGVIRLQRTLPNLEEVIVDW